MRRMIVCIVFISLFAVPVNPLNAFENDTAMPSSKEESSKTYDLDPVVVTAPAMTSPLEVQFDPKAPQQPIPAQDGAAILKTVPGMNVIRKGGTDGDPVFRGMAGSRLNILLDGETILGGCGNRMDPPTAYVFPEAYDRITVLKGPQTVIYGPGSSAGVVLFEREFEHFEKPDIRFNSSLVGGSFDRYDGIADVTAGNQNVYFRGIGTYSHSGDYEDGDGNDVHSEYKRWSLNGAVGWTPDKDTRLEVTGAHSDGEAAYGDRTMDGTMFKRWNYGVKFEKKNLNPWLEKVEVQAFYNYIDHVMDNYSLRTFVPTMMMPNPSVSNPTRETFGGRAALKFALTDTTKLVVGGDLQSNEHTIRSTMNERTMPYKSKPRIDDASFDQKALFAEFTQHLSDRNRIIAGFRGDWWEAEDKRDTLKLGTSTVANPTAGKERDEFLPSGFIRYEHDFAEDTVTFYSGLGYVERFPDYWELISAGKEGPTASAISAFSTTDPEKTAQLDVGATWKSGPWRGYITGFFNKIDDFILIQSKVSRGAGPTARSATITRNVDATTWGGEAGVTYAFTSNLSLDTSISYVRGENDTEDRSLAQIPPLEGRVGLNWDNKTWFLGSLLRLVASQDRVAINEGNIVGQDIGDSSGFAVFSINGGWRPMKKMKQALITAGIDNLFDTTYAEHLSRSGSTVSGYEQTTRVNEPGRTFWVKGNIAF